MRSSWYRSWSRTILRKSNVGLSSRARALPRGPSRTTRSLALVRISPKRLPSSSSTSYFSTMFFARFLCPMARVGTRCTSGYGIPDLECSGGFIFPRLGPRPQSSCERRHSVCSVGPRRPRLSQRKRRRARGRRRHRKRVLVTTLRHIILFLHASPLYLTTIYYA